MVSAPSSVESQLREALDLYVEVKQLILMAEEVDPQFRSNVMTMKELRDAFDHFMRFHAELLSSTQSPESEVYKAVQFEKMKGHIFRAGYDAIDGIAVSYRVRLVKAMEGISNEAIAAVYPTYWSEFPEIDRLIAEIVEHRSKKDIGRETLAHIRSYFGTAKKVAEKCKSGLNLVAPMLSWQEKNRKQWFRDRLLEAVCFSIPTALLVALFLQIFQIAWGRRGQIDSVAHTNAITNQVVSPSATNGTRHP